MKESELSRSSSKHRNNKAIMEEVEEVGEVVEEVEEEQEGDRPYTTQEGSWWRFRWR